VLSAGATYQEDTYTVTWDQTTKPASSNQTDLAQSNGDTFYITDVQFEIGDARTDMEIVSIQEDFNECQRYYAKSYPMTTTPGATSAYGAEMSMTVSGTTHVVNVKYLEDMNSTSPTVTLWSLNGTANSVSLVDLTMTHITDVPVSEVINSSGKGFSAFTVTSGLSLAAFHWTAETNS
jgi:hypothetical protein